MESRKYNDTGSDLMRGRKRWKGPIEVKWRVRVEFIVKKTIGRDQGVVRFNSVKTMRKNNTKV